MAKPEGLERHYKIEFVSEKPEHQAFLDDTSNCCLCGTELHFVFKVDFANHKVEEQAFCPECQVRLKTKACDLQ